MKRLAAFNSRAIKLLPQRRKKRTRRGNGSRARWRDGYFHEIDSSKISSRMKNISSASLIRTNRNKNVSCTTLSRNIECRRNIVHKGRPPCSGNRERTFVNLGISTSKERNSLDIIRAVFPRTRRGSAASGDVLATGDHLPPIGRLSILARVEDRAWPSRGKKDIPATAKTKVLPRLWPRRRRRLLRRWPRDFHGCHNG